MLLRAELRPRRSGRGHSDQSVRAGGGGFNFSSKFRAYSGIFHSMIIFENIYKSFGENHVLRGVNLTVERGESMVIIGGSGTGKSVLIKTVLGLVEPDSGRILVDGEDVTQVKRDTFLSRFGMLFQGGALFDSMPVWQNVAFRLQRGALKRPAVEAREIAIEKLRRVGLAPEVADRFPAELSGGMQKRVSLARAIAAEPEIIFFDEPTTGLDPIMSGVINELTREIVVEMGVTAMTITHDMTSVDTIADKVAMLHRGRIQWCGARADLAHSGDPHVEQFVNGRAEGPIETLR
jgi:phospholipid/cholesterol/gamma-HCH transport system ATP-binding protein